MWIYRLWWSSLYLDFCRNSLIYYNNSRFLKEEWKARVEFLIFFFNHQLAVTALAPVRFRPQRKSGSGKHSHPTVTMRFSVLMLQSSTILLSTNQCFEVSSVYFTFSFCTFWRFIFDLTKSSPVYDIVTQNNRAYYDTVAQDCGEEIPYKNYSAALDISSTAPPASHPKIQKKVKKKTSPLEYWLPITAK